MLFIHRTSFFASFHQTGNDGNINPEFSASDPPYEDELPELVGRSSGYPDVVQGNRHLKILRLQPEASGYVEGFFMFIFADHFWFCHFCSYSNGSFLLIMFIIADHVPFC
jgi:hypothetical protein